MSQHICICGRVWHDPDGDCHEECGLCHDITPCDDLDAAGMCPTCAPIWMAQVAADEAELSDTDDCPECGTPLDFSGKCPAPAKH